jgi:hypothetical protein
MTWSILRFEVGLRLSDWPSFPARKPSAGEIQGK